MSQEHQLRALIVNDNPIQVMQIDYMLKDLGIVTQTAQNGFEAIEMTKSAKPCFDFILMDLDMPIMNGWQACTLIKEFYSDEQKLFRGSNSLNF